MTELPWSIVKVWYQNDWGRYRRRDERLCEAFAQRGHRVLHLEPPLAAGAPGAGRVETRCDGRLIAYAPVARAWPELLGDLWHRMAGWGIDPARSILWINAPSGLGRGMLSGFGERFARRVVEVEDDHRHYSPEGSDARYEVARSYEFALRRSDLFVSNSATVLDAFSGWCPNTLHLPNAVDPREFDDPLTPSSIPRWWPPSGKVLGYVGNLRLRLRTDLLEAVARRFPDVTLVLAGEPVDGLPDRIRSCANVVTPGHLDPSLVPWFLSKCDGLLLPHREGALTECMDPQKMYEYLASGTPVVSTPVAGARERASCIELASSVEETVGAVQRVLNGTARGSERDRRAAVQNETWSARVESILQSVDAVQDAGGPMAREAAYSYREHDRPEVCALVPESALRVLDVGCGAGALGGRLVDVGSHAGREVDGIELDEKAAERARERLSEVFVGDAVEQLRTRPDDHYDAVILADLLEHLPQPDVALREVRRVLRPGGRAILSLPNVRHWSVLSQLLEGDFQYEDAGILDRTHLRFFTRRSAQRLFRECGFDVEAVRGSRWDDQVVPPAVIDALAQCGLSVETLAEEGRDQQMLFALRAEADATTNSPAHPNERISVVVPVHGAADYTRRCLEGLARTARDWPLDIVVVDNGSTDETPQLLASTPGIRVLRNETNLGFSAAVNQGLRAAQGTFTCVLNNDVALPDGWLAPLVETVTRDPRIGLVGPCSNYVNGRQLVEVQLRDETAIEAYAVEHRQRHHGQREDTSFLSGFCLLGATADFLAWGGFSEAYPLGTYEDNELSRAVRRAGRRLVVARDSFVFHFGNRTFQQLGEDVMERQRCNRERFEARHADDAARAAGRARERGDFVEALRRGTEALRAAPSDLDAQLEVAATLVQTGQWGPARATLDRYRRACPDDPRVEQLMRAMPSEASSVMR